MKLFNAILRPGIIEQVLENGEVKVSAPGLFSVQDLEGLPPVYPFFTSSANAYSSPVKGDEVWVLNVTDNPRQLYWFRKDDYKKNNKNLINAQNVEVLCNREFGGGMWATIYFSDGSGWVIRNGDSKIQINSDGDILLDTGFPGRVIDINSKNISLGSEGESKHRAAYGDVIEEVINSIYAVLEGVRTAADCNAYTKPIAVALQAKLPTIKERIPEISSGNVTLE